MGLQRLHEARDGSKLDGRVGNKTRAVERLGVKQVEYEDNVDRECDRRRGRCGSVTVRRTSQKSTSKIHSDADR